MGVWGVGFRVDFWGEGFRFGVGFRVEDVGFGVWGLWLGVQDVGCRVEGVGSGVWGLCRIGAHHEHNRGFSAWG